MTQTPATTSEVIDALGGTSAVAAIGGWRPTRVSNWRAAGRFPSHTYRILSGALDERGLAVPNLWSFSEVRP